MKPHEHEIFRFGEFVLLPGERLLLHAGRPVAITGKAFDVLWVLVRNAGHLVTKDELLAQAWPGLVVEEVNLSVNVSAVRKALSASEAAAEWIETVPRQGYRFNAPVEVDDLATVDLAALRGLDGGYRSEAQPAAGIPGRARRVTRYAAIALVLLAALVVGVAKWPAPAPYASVAVLPIKAAAAADAYLADGLMERIIDGLGRSRSIAVSPRASAFRAAEADAAAAGRRLGVAAVLTGALARRGDALRLDVELLEAASGRRAWVGTYEAAGTDIPRLEARVTADLARALGLRLTEGQQSELARRASPHAGAYLAYLQGRYLWNQRSEESLQQAVAHFTRAIEVDPGFALAHAALADAHTTLGYLGYLPPVATFPAARPHALKALQLDPTLAPAHAALAYIKFYFDWDWAGAREEFARALALDPGDPVSRQWHAIYLLAAGLPEDAFREIRAAQRLDPLSLAINTDVGLHHYYNGRYDEAITQLKAVLGMKSDFLLAHLWLGRTYLQLGRFDEALAEASHARGRVREWPVLVAARGFTLGTAGRREEARAVLTEMERLSKQRFVTAYGVALVHAGLGQKEEAFAWLEKAFEERSHWLVWLRLDPRWKNLRDDPRFSALVARMRYPD